jgi:hypothetical protein
VDLGYGFAERIWHYDELLKRWVFLDDGFLSFLDDGLFRP